MQSVINQVENIRTGYNTFQDTYGFVPGDATASQCAKWPEFVNHPIAASGVTVTYSLPAGKLAPCVCSPASSSQSASGLCGGAGASVTASCTLSADNGAACTPNIPLGAVVSNSSYAGGDIAYYSSASGLKGNGIIETGYEQFYAIKYLEAANVIALNKKSASYGYLIAGLHSDNDFGINYNTPSAIYKNMQNSFPQVGSISTMRWMLAGYNSSLLTAIGTAPLHMPSINNNNAANKHWMDKNFMLIVTSDGWASNSMPFTVKDAIAIKTKIDDPSKPIGGNVVAQGFNLYSNSVVSKSPNTTTTNNYISVSSAGATLDILPEDNTVATDGCMYETTNTEKTYLLGSFAFLGPKTASGVKVKYYDSVPGCKIAFLLD
jgi:hypothetical protein